MGKVVTLIDTSEFEKSVKEVSDQIEKEEQQAQSLSESTSYNLVWMARKLDEWYIDPIIGLIFPGFGDMIGSVATLPAVYVAMFKLHSIKLTIAILASMAIDLIVGIIPFVGDIADAFYKSSKMASRLIVGYVEQDPEVIEEIDKRATWGTIGLIVIGLVLWLMYSAVVSLFHWVSSLF